MSLSFFCFVSLLFLPCCLSSSCLSIPESEVPCNKSIEIKPPFIFVENTTDICEQGISIRCGHSVNLPRVYLFHLPSLWFYLENIIYNPDNNSQNKLIVRDSVLGSSLNSSSCGNLLISFLTPSYAAFDYDQYLSFSTSVKNFCASPNQSFQSLILGREYALNYSATTDKNLPVKCYRKSQNASFEWKFSFNDDGSVVLLSAQYSYSLLSDSGCFGQSIVGDSSINESPLPGNRSQTRRKIILICATLGLVSFLVGLILILMLRWRKSCSECILLRKCRPKKNIELLLEKYGSFAPKRYKYGEIKKITNSFQESLGKGGFGTVYKGKLPGGRLVAVKMLRESSSHAEEFLNEVLSIGRTSHVNVVSLLGFCIEGSKQALIYEYMPNGSLDKYIYCENPKEVLGWEKLYEIAIGIARGLEYLHRDCNARIVHFDIKPQNILLDEDFNPKIADFGLAKLCPPKESILSMAEMRGTVGYIAPEVFSRSFGAVSTKSDVYSYGMMVLEMVGGRRNAKPSTDNPSRVYFPHWLYDCLAEGNEIQACDGSTGNKEIAKKMGTVGLWCTQTIPGNRPTISRVIEMLEKGLDELELPPKPYSSSPPHFAMLSEDISSS